MRRRLEFQWAVSVSGGGGCSEPRGGSPDARLLVPTGACVAHAADGTSPVCISSCDTSSNWFRCTVRRVLKLIRLLL